MDARNNATLWIVGALMLAAGAAGGWALSRWQDSDAHVAPAPANERKVLYWYDPMVPAQKFDKPGKSPFMDMQLVPRYADEADAGASSPGVSVSAAAQQSLGLRVARAERQSLAAPVDVVGTVVLNERDVAVLQSRANGYVERVHARAPGDVIAAGAPIAELLLPDWLAAQHEYLAVKATGDAALAAASRQRLMLLGMPAALIERVDASGRPEAAQTVVAPIGGLIAELMVRRGMTVAQGMTLARINGLSTVWLEAAVPEVLAAALAPGQAAEVRLPALPGTTIRARVSAVLPEADRDTRTLRVRLELPNPGLKLRAGMFAQVALQGAAAGDAVTVPAEAVLRTGRRALVYLQDAPGRYRPVEVELGPEVGERIVIRKGIEAGQQVVASGQFLIDSEASLRGITARVATPSSAPAPAPAAAAEPLHHVDGIVREAAADGLITLEHGPVPALKWPPMTMPFKLAQPDLARGLKPGDKVHFGFRQQGDESVITDIRKRGTP